MFERFTERARQVVVLAQDESRTLGHRWIGTEHLLLGVIREEGAASGALAAAGLSLDAARAAVVALVGTGEYVESGQIPFTPLAKRALEASLRESIRLDSNAVTPELVLLGVLTQRSGTSACMLRDGGVDAGAVVVALGLDGDVDLASVQPAGDAGPERRVGDAGAPRAAEVGEQHLFARFTERARNAVALAEDEARALKHRYVGTEHILLGLLREEDSLAARVLESLGVTLDEVRAQVARIVGRGDEGTRRQLPFTPRTKTVLERALREALSLGHNYIGTEHILLGLVRENEGVAARILLDFDADAEKIRNAVVRTLAGPGRRRETMSTTVPTPGVAPAEAIDDATRAMTVGDLIEAVRIAKEDAIGNQDFERASTLRDLERRLVGLLETIASILGRGD